MQLEDLGFEFWNILNYPALNISDFNFVFTMSTCTCQQPSGNKTILNLLVLSHTLRGLRTLDAVSVFANHLNHSCKSIKRSLTLRDLVVQREDVGSQETELLDRRRLCPIDLLLMCMMCKKFLSEIFLLHQS